MYRDTQFVSFLTHGQASHWRPVPPRIRITDINYHLYEHKRFYVAEWIMLKISGQQCEPLELDKEDRKRIEEIKRELLLTNPIKVNQ